MPPQTTIDVSGMKPCPDISPNQLALKIACGTKMTLIRKEDTIPLMRCPFFCSLYQSKRCRRWPVFKRMQRSIRWANMPLLLINDVPGA
ncbi:hypothetical protein TNCV_1956351 [Trichonephila clavipes]|nr:hypothetical protein TNCV_1956351 [Trichonephila clavipes]